MSSAEDEIDVALNIAALVVVPASVVEESVVSAVKGAVVEGGLVASHHGGDRLVVWRVGDAHCGIILPWMCMWKLVKLTWLRIDGEEVGKSSP